MGPYGMKPQTGDFTEVIIQPRTLRTLYSIPEEERSGWAGRGNNRQGVVAFDDFFLPVRDDPCFFYLLS